MSTRRPPFEKLNGSIAQHAGLWLDKFIVDQARTAPGAGDTSKAALVDAVAAIKEPAEYKRFFDRWSVSLTELCARMQSAGTGKVLTRDATVQGRMIVGIGTESVLESSITVHRTYGVPYIPGSALKGVTSRLCALHMEQPEWRRGGSAFTTVFGSPDAAGYVTFFDALLFPGSGFDGKALHADTVTEHHRDYYQGNGQAPTDWDSPTPIPFLSATGVYRIALAGPEAWVDITMRVLATALSQLGVGAKTSSGYGRLTVVDVDQLPAPQLDPKGTSVDADVENAPFAGETSPTLPQSPREDATQPTTAKATAQRPKVGAVIDAKVVSANRDKGSIRVQLRAEGGDQLTIKNIQMHFFDRLLPGSIVKCKVEELDKAGGKITRVSWKR